MKTPNLLGPSSSAIVLTPYLGIEPGPLSRQSTLRLENSSTMRKAYGCRTSMSSRLSQMVRDNDDFRISCSCAKVSDPPGFAFSPFSYQNLSLRFSQE